MTAFPGMTWEYIDNNMTLPRYYAIRAYWKICPPTHTMTMRIAQMLGYKPEMLTSAAAEPDGEVFWDESFYKDTPQTPYKIGGAEAMKKDFAAAGGRNT